MIKERLEKLGLGWAEIIGLVTSFLIVTGISYFYGFYAVGLHADWIINLLTTKELLLSNIKFGAIVLTVFLFLEDLFFSDSKTKQKQGFALGAGCILGVLILSIWRDEDWLEALSYLIVLISVFGIIYFKYMGKLICILLIVFVVPFMNGLNAYENKINSKLPEVSLKDDSRKWYLFESFSDKAVLIDNVKKVENIKVVQVSELENIKVR